MFPFGSYIQIPYTKPVYYTNILMRYILLRKDCNIDPVNRMDKAKPLNIAIRMNEAELRLTFVKVSWMHAPIHCVYCYYAEDHTSKVWIACVRGKNQKIVLDIYNPTSRHGTLSEISHTSTSRAVNTLAFHPVSVEEMATYKTAKILNLLWIRFRGRLTEGNKSTFSFSVRSYYSPHMIDLKPPTCIYWGYTVSWLSGIQVGT